MHGLGATVGGLHLGNTWAGQRFLSERPARTGHTACAPGCAGSPPSLISGLRRERLASGRPKLDNESFGPKITNRFLPAVVYSLGCESDGRSSFGRLPRAIFGVGCSLSVPVRPDTHCTGGGLPHGNIQQTPQYGPHLLTLRKPWRRDDARLGRRIDVATRGSSAHQSPREAHRCHPTQRAKIGPACRDRTESETVLAPSHLRVMWHQESNAPVRPFLERDHSFGPEDIASMSAGFEAALRKLGLVVREDPATVAVAKSIIELAKEGEREPGRLCDQAVKRLST